MGGGGGRKRRQIGGTTSTIMCTVTPGTPDAKAGPEVSDQVPDGCTCMINILATSVIFTLYVFSCTSENVMGKEALSLSTEHRMIHWTRDFC